MPGYWETQWAAAGQLADVAFATIKSQVAAAEAATQAAQVQVADLTLELAVANAKIASLIQAEADEDNLPPPPPTKPARGVNAGGSFATISAAKGRWPASTILRCFTGDGTYTMPGWVPKGVELAFSNKPNLVDFAAGKYDQQELAWADAARAAGLKARRIVMHEPDVKMNSGGSINGFTVAQWQAAQDHLADLYADNPDVTVSIVVAAHCLTGPQSGRTVESWMRPKVHSYGFDFDGNRNTALPYVDYSPEVARMAQIKALGVDVWVPEFGVPKIAADAGDSIRAKWLLDTEAALEKAGASAIILFDAPPEGPLSGASFNAWTSVLNF